MRIQPRQQILDIWRSLLSTSYDGQKWVWGGRDGANAISDAEQLLCLLYPATEIDSFALDRPDDIADDIKSALAPLGEDAEIGAAVVAAVEDYIARYTDPDDEPIFAAGSYLRADDQERPPTEQQRGLEVVDSYSMSLTLCLAALRFLRVFQRYVLAQTRRDAKGLAERIDVLDKKVGIRLTAAMTGLVRSFVVNTVPRKSAAGQSLLAMLNQTDSPEETVADGITRRLERVRVRLRNDVTLGQTPDTDLDNEKLLFECGWSWGIVDQARPVDFVDARIAAQTGFADPRPYLYFTIVALDGINDLTSQRTRELDLLDEEQRRLSEALQTRWELTQRYWSTTARYGSGRWPLEDIPWQTSDGDESDYFSLVVIAVLIQDLIARTAGDDDLTRSVTVFDQLARRGRVITRVVKSDHAGTLHVPGVKLGLVGSDRMDPDGPPLMWIVADYAPVLLKRTLQAARLSGNVAARDQLMALAESTMDHLDLRVLREGPAAGLWDDPTQVFSHDGREPTTKPSWYMTERVIECLVAADRTFREPPLRTPSMVNRTVELLNEAEHLLNQEMLDVSDENASHNRIALARIEQRLTRARRLVSTRPGTAYSLATEALIALDELAYARLDAARSS